ncbi:MAG TPA: hypothetical protein VE526_11875 [Solirubrobacteraceae bacterium]|nr:hypothetical protein [Solirubrobacteraceae bacterium]
MAKLVPAFRALPAEMQQAAACAGALMLTLFLPWYSAQLLQADGRSFNRSAFGEFSFVEAAVLLVAAGVLYLVWARSQRKAFHLPGGDGTVIMLAGGWAALLIVWRLFDTPEARTIEFGLQWGIFVALAAAVALSLAGARVRAAHRPEPPNPAAEEGEWERPAREPRRTRRTRPAEPAAVTEVLRDPPGWEGEPPEAPGRVPRVDPPGAIAAPRDEPPAEDDDPPADRLF